MQPHPTGGWGKPSCSECGQGNPLLKAAFASDCPDEMPILNAIVFLNGQRSAGVSATMSACVFLFNTGVCMMHVRECVDVMLRTGVESCEMIPAILGSQLLQ